MQLDDEETLARLDALRREAYSRNGSAQSFAELRELERALSRERQDAAELRLEPKREPEPEPSITPPPPALEQPAKKKRSWRRIVVIALAAILVAAGGFSLGKGSQPTPQSSSALAGSPGESQHGVATLALLETSQQPSDIPPFSLGSDITASTVHVLTAAGAPGVTVYGALTHEKLICLIAVTADLHSADTCATESQFVSDGIRLRITTDTIVKNDAGFSNFAFYQYFWSSDGSISGSSNMYLFPAAPHN